MTGTSPLTLRVGKAAGNAGAASQETCQERMTMSPGEVSRLGGAIETRHEFRGIGDIWAFSCKETVRWLCLMPLSSAFPASI